LRCAAQAAQQPQLQPQPPTAASQTAPGAAAARARRASASGLPGLPVLTEAELAKLPPSTFLATALAVRPGKALVLPRCERKKERKKEKEKEKQKQEPPRETSQGAKWCPRLCSGVRSVELWGSLWERGSCAGVEAYVMPNGRLRETKLLRVPRRALLLRFLPLRHLLPMLAEQRRAALQQRRAQAMQALSLPAVMSSSSLTVNTASTSPSAAAAPAMTSPTHASTSQVGSRLHAYWLPWV
jgi:hypothetical protein